MVSVGAGGCATVSLMAKIMAGLRYYVWQLGLANYPWWIHDDELPNVL